MTIIDLAQLCWLRAFLSNIRELCAESLPIRISGEQVRGIPRVLCSFPQSTRVHFWCCNSTTSGQLIPCCDRDLVSLRLPRDAGCSHHHVGPDAPFPLCEHVLPRRDSSRTSTRSTKSGSWRKTAGARARAPWTGKRRHCIEHACQTEEAQRRIDEAQSCQLVVGSCLTNPCSDNVHGAAIDCLSSPPLSWVRVVGHF